MKTLVANAADEEQVHNAEEKLKTKRIQEMEDMRDVLKLPQGRRVMWKLLSHCKVFESIYHPSALIHHNSGRQDVGHFIMAEIMAANEMAFLQMMSESKGTKDE